MTGSAETRVRALTESHSRVVLVDLGNHLGVSKSLMRFVRLCVGNRSGHCLSLNMFLKCF